MGTTKEELHTLVEQVPADKAGHVLELIRDTLDPPVRRRDNPMEQLIRRHWRRVAARTGLDVDQLPKNGSMSGAVISGHHVEVTKDWVSEDVRHRLTKLEVQGHEIIILERMMADEGSGLRYEVRVFTGASEERAEVSVPFR